jgi:hypothetical protein
MSQPEPLAALDEIAARAREAQVKLRAGLAVNGATALRRIEERAKDEAQALRDCRSDDSRDGARA